MIRSALMTVMTGAAIKAGRGLKRDFGEVSELQVSMKGPGDFVSLADKRAEKSLYQELAKARPGYGFVLEEGGRVEGTDKSHTWHIDPLDATTNFLHAIPHFAISVALEREGQIVAGVIYNPATDDMFVTEKGQGAFGNNRRLRVAARAELSQALFGCGIPHLGKSAHPHLVKAIDSKDVRTRRNALQVFLNVPSLLDKGIIPNLNARLADDDLAARTRAARLLWALEQTGKPVVDVLLAGIRS